MPVEQGFMFELPETKESVSAHKPVHYFSLYTIKPYIGCLEEILADWKLGAYP